MKKIYLFRHGETNWNKNDNIPFAENVHDVFLNETGVQQAYKNAELLKNKGIGHVYSSNLKRAYQTGKILAQAINVEMSVVDGLQEFSTYDKSCDGLTRPEIKEKIGAENFDLRNKEKDALMDWRPLNCETKREARKRIFDTIVNICKSAPYNIIAIASHGVALKEFLRACDYEDDSGLKNCEVVEVEYKTMN
jgi:broad specificity phosphatase PhoE